MDYQGIRVEAGQARKRMLQSSRQHTAVAWTKGQSCSEGKWLGVQQDIRTGWWEEGEAIKGREERHIESDGVKEWQHHTLG